MKKIKKYIIILIAIILLATIVALLDKFYFKNNDIAFKYPWKNALFPREFVVPTFSWIDKDNSAKSWEITIKLKNNKNYISENVNKAEWKPSPSVWESIKLNSEFEDIQLIVKRSSSGKRDFLNKRAELTIKISKDSVAAPILYREIPLPFVFAEQNAQFMSFSAYYVGDEKGPYPVLAQFRVCGNCHSLSANGKKIALDFDAAARDKGGYFIADVDTQITFTKANYLSWSKLLNHSTFGMLSKISWDGNYVVTTVKDRAVSEKFPEKEKKAYSQLFFPVNGVLSIYNIKTKEFKELPGANDLDYVQTNAIWTPNGKNLIFARAKALPYDKKKHVMDIVDKKIIDEFIDGKREFKFDLYMIPFNKGKGGKAIPIKGASNNGKSNYFPSISPNGKWLIFCKAENFMMLQPDSRLWISNLETGETRELESNLPSMNSWHAWSPNGKWVVFASKLLNMYTDLYLTHIDENGHASTPILLEKASKPNKALNYPEFVNRDPKLPLKMVYDYVDLYHIEIEIENKNYEKAKILLEEYLAQAQIGTPGEFQKLAWILKTLGRDDEAEEYLKKKKEIEQDYYKPVQK